MGEIPFSMTYGVKAAILMEIGLCSMRVSNFTPEKNDTRFVEDFDLLEEQREMALIRLANYQQKLAQRYDWSLRLREFVAGDLVLQKAVGSMKDLSAGKLALNWEGPYRITTVVGARAYYLEDMIERSLP